MTAGLFVILPFAMGKEIIVKLRRPHVNQQRVVDCTSRFIVMNCGRRFGKSVVSQILATKDALAGKRVAYATPTYKLARTFFKEYEANIPASIVKTNKTDLTLEFKTGGLIQFFTGEAIDNFRGLWFDKAIIDEASYFPNLLNDWNNAIRPTLTDKKGGAIFLSTPRGKNDFYKLTLRAVSQPENWSTFKFTSYDNPHIDPTEIDAARLEIPEANFEQEYLANAMENADNPFGYAHIRGATRPLSTKPPVVFGIDLAKSYDYTVITGLDEDCRVCYWDRFRTDWNDVNNRILALPPVPMCIDATGVGSPIVEALQLLREDIEGFVFTSTSKQILIGGLVTAIQQNNIGFPEGVITSELEIFEYVYTKNGVKYSAPDGLHDDAVCSLALARRCWLAHGIPAIYHIR